MSNVSFPGLGLEFTISNVAFSIFGFDIYWYGIIIAAGVLIGIGLGLKNARKLGIDDDKFLDVILVTAIVAIVGGRSFYVIFNDDINISSIKDFFNLRGGGMAFYGVILGGIAAAFIMCKLEKVKVSCFLDDIAIGLLVGQGLGRWGNFFNQELFGTNTDLPWGMYSDTIEKYIIKHATSLYIDHGIVLTEGPVHPTFLYESIWCFIGAFVVSKVIKKRRFDGQVFCSYLIWNGIGRGFTESLRTDALFLGNIRISQFVCLTLALIGAIIIIIKKRKIKYEGDDEYLKCYVLTDEWADELKLIELRDKDPKAYKQAIKEKKSAASEEVFDEEAAEDIELITEDDNNTLSDDELAILAAAGLDNELSTKSDNN